PTRGTTVSRRRRKARGSTTALRIVSGERHGRVHHVNCPEVVCSICSRLITPDDPIRRDGEALVPGNCRVRRPRDASKPPIKIIPEPDGVTSVVRARLMARMLPRVEVDKVWTGLGKGLPCSGCGHTITPAEIEPGFDDGSS